MKQVKKKQKHKSKGSVRTITKQVKADSFFNFFDPPAVPDDPNAEVDEDTQVRGWYIVFIEERSSNNFMQIARTCPYLQVSFKAADYFRVGN